MIFGNGRPASGFTGGQYGIEVGAHPAFVQYKFRHKGHKGLKGSMCRMHAHEHNAQWALVGGVQNWHCSGQVTAEENEHH